MSLFLFATLNFMEGFPVPKGKDFQQVDIVCSHHEQSFANPPKGFVQHCKKYLGRVPRVTNFFGNFYWAFGTRFFDLPNLTGNYVNITTSRRSFFEFY